MSKFRVNHEKRAYVAGGEWLEFSEEIYYAYIPEQKILLLLGGNKNGQDKDIRQAKKILHQHVSFKK